jgi:hypothetical protein
MKTLKGMLRGSVRRRTTQDTDVRVAPVVTGIAHLEFRLCSGQWMTSKTYILDVGDGRDDVDATVTRALADLAEDQRRYPAI